MTPAADQPSATKRQPFVKNVVWTWAGVAVSLLYGILLSPYLIRRLGDEGYGIWVLAFGLIEYYWLFDLGFRTAAVKYTAHYWATGETEKINEILSTGVVYASGVAVLQVVATLLLARNAERLFRVSPQYRGAFTFLILAIGLSWALGTVFNLFSACLEGFQHFNLSSGISVSVTALRGIGTALLLWRGYGLVELGIMAVASQMIAYGLNVYYVRRVFPGQRLSLALAKFSVFKQMAVYGIHAFTAMIGYQLQTQGAPVLIGHFRPTAYVGYFSLPVKLVWYPVLAVDRVGVVTNSKTAELAARADLGAVARLGMTINRYCLAMFLPAAIFLLAYGRELITVWIRKPEFADMSAPLLPILLIGTTLADAAQLNSGWILYGLGKHRASARALLAEGSVLVATLLWVLPRYGIVGAAWATAILAALNRGLFTPWLVSRYVGARWGAYMASIYMRPVACALPVVGLAFWLKSQVLTGGTLLSLAAAGLAIAGCYYALAFFACLDREHRSVFLAWAARRWGRRA